MEWIGWAIGAFVVAWGLLESYAEMKEGRK